MIYACHFGVFEIFVRHVSSMWHIFIKLYQYEIIPVLLFNDLYGHEQKSDIMKFNSKKIFLVTALAISSSFLGGCSSVYDKHVQWQSVNPEHFPVLNAIGYAPISLQKSTNKTQRMLMALKASKISAYAELAEQVYGQQISSQVTMSDLLINNDQLTSSIQGVIRGAKVVKSYPVGDTYATELSLDFEDVYNIYQAKLNRKEIKNVEYF